MRRAQKHCGGAVFVGPRAEDRIHLECDRIVRAGRVDRLAAEEQVDVFFLLGELITGGLREPHA